MSQSSVIFDPNAFDYNVQLAQAGLDDIDSLEYGMQKGDRLLRRDTMNGDSEIELELANGIVFKTNITYTLVHYSWGGGFMNWYIKSANEVTIKNLSHSVSLEGINLIIRKVRYTLYNKAGKGNEVVERENTVEFGRKESPLNEYDRNITFYNKVDAFCWGHHANWHAYLEINRTDGSFYGDYDRAVPLFTI